VAHHLLRACADGCKVNHLLRAADTYAIGDRVADCHEAVLTAFMDLAGLTLTPQQRIQCVQPVRVGGCGIKGASQLQPAARMSALATFYSVGARRVGVPACASQVDSRLLAPVLADLTARLGTNMDPLSSWSTNMSLLATASPDHRSQQWWSTALGQRSVLDLLDSAPPRDQARLLEQRSGGLGSTWMTALPARGTSAVFPSAEYSLGLRWWLGAPLHRTADAVCPGCGLPADQEGDHFLCCRRVNFSTRHNAVQDAIYLVLSSAGLAVSREVPLPTCTDAHLRPADLLLPNWLAGRPTALDVTVSHGWSQAAQTGPVTRDNWRPFLRKREADKHAKYDAPCQRDGWHFSALAVGTWGGLGPEGAKTLAHIVKRASSGADTDSKGQAQRAHYEAIGVALFHQVFHLLGAKNLIC
jgi:hypothetical protein